MFEVSLFLLALLPNPKWQCKRAYGLADIQQRHSVASVLALNIFPSIWHFFPISAKYVSCLSL